MSQPATNPTWVEQVFGVSARDPEIINVIRRGAQPARAARFRDELGLTRIQFARWLGVHPRTMQRAEEDGKPLGLSATDRLYRACELLDYGTARLGSREALRAMLHEKARRLYGETPADVMDTTPGLAKVRRLF